MCTATRWLTKGASIALALCLFLPSRTTPAEESVWQKAIREAIHVREQGRYAEAEHAQLLALTEAEEFGPEDRRLALSLNNLAALYHATGRLREAEPLYRRALVIWEKDSERLEVASVLSNLVRLCLDQEKYVEVEPLSKRALAIAQGLAPKHPEVANSLNNLADLYTIQGHYAQAEPLYRQALAILEENFGPEDSEVAYGLSHLAKLSVIQARYAEAEASIAERLRSSRKTQGKKDLPLPAV